MEVHEKPIYRGRGNWLKREGLDSFQSGGGGVGGLGEKEVGGVFEGVWYPNSVYSGFLNKI